MDLTELNNNIKRDGTLPRIHFMDELRGFCIILMIFFHSFFTLASIFEIPFFMSAYNFFFPAQPFFAGIFILISGMSSRLSRSNLKRGIILLVVSFVMTLALHIFMPSQIILFGILHFLAFAILFFALTKPLLDKIPVSVGIVVLVILFIFSYHVPINNGSFFGIKGLFQIPISEALKTNKWLFPLGFSFINTSDYFPIIPWLFLFLIGTFLGVLAQEEKLPKWMNKSRVPFLSWIGKHSMIIYLAHQPVIFALSWVVLKIIK